MFGWRPFLRQPPPSLLPSGRLPLGCPPLDELLGGGLEKGVVTEVYGEAGTGKTNVALVASLSALRQGGKVLYIDTEGLSIERFEQIAGSEGRSLLSRVLLSRPLSLEEQGRAVHNALRILEGSKDVHLLVLDSATLLYRLELGSAGGWDSRVPWALRRLLSQVGALVRIAHTFSVPVLLTNQVYEEPEGGGLVPLGGRALEHFAKAIVRLERIGGERGVRRAILLKHRSRPEGTEARFRIVQGGMEPL